MVAPAVKLAVAAGAAATAGYVSYQIYKEQAELEAAKEAAAALREERMQRLREMAEERASREEEGGHKGSRGKGSTMDLIASLDEDFVSEALAELRTMGEAAQEKAADCALQVPLLGDGESPSVLVLAAMFLLGRTLELERYLLLPFLSGLPSPLINMAEFTQFGFALSRISETGSRVLIRWLAGLEEVTALTEDVGGNFDLSHPSFAPLWALTLKQDDGQVAVSFYRAGQGAFRGGGEGGGGAQPGSSGGWSWSVWSELEALAAALRAMGLHAEPAWKFTIQPRYDSSRGPTMEVRRFGGGISVLGTADELLVSTFPLKGSGRGPVFSLEGGVHEEEGGRSISFNRGQVASAPPVDPLLVSEDLRRRRCLAFVQWRYAGLARLAAQRAGKGQGLGWLGPLGWSLEHFQAASGQPDMLRWQPDPEDDEEAGMDVVEMLRDKDMDLVQQGGEAVRAKLAAQLLLRVPRDPGLPEPAASEALESEVEEFASDFLQLAGARLIQTPVCARGRTPMDVAADRPLTEEPLDGGEGRGSRGGDSKNPGLLKAMLRQVERQRNHLSDHLTNVPAGWYLFTLIGLVVLFVILVEFTAVFLYLLLNSVSLLRYLTELLPTFITAAAVYPASVAWNLAWCKAYAVHVQGTPNAPAALAALAALARSTYILAAKACGWKVPLARDNAALEARCARVLRGWRLRMLAAHMAKQVSKKQLVSGEGALLLMKGVAAAVAANKEESMAAAAAEARVADDTDAAGDHEDEVAGEVVEGGVMPGSSEATEAWLELPCDPELSASSEEAAPFAEAGMSFGDAVRCALLEGSGQQQQQQQQQQLLAEASAEGEDSAPSRRNEKQGRTEKRVFGGGSRDQTGTGGGGGGGGGGWSDKGMDVREGSDGAAALPQTDGPNGSSSQRQPPRESRYATVRELLEEHGFRFERRRKHFVWRRYVMGADGRPRKQTLVTSSTPSDARAARNAAAAIRRMGGCETTADIGGCPDAAPDAAAESMPEEVQGAPDLSSVSKDARVERVIRGQAGGGKRGHRKSKHKGKGRF